MCMCFHTCIYKYVYACSCVCAYMHIWALRDSCSGLLPLALLGHVACCPKFGSEVSASRAEERLTQPCAPCGPWPKLQNSTKEDHIRKEGSGILHDIKSVSDSGFSAVEGPDTSAGLSAFGVEVCGCKVWDGTYPKPLNPWFASSLGCWVQCEFRRFDKSWAPVSAQNWDCWRESGFIDPQKGT